jgi:dTDP-4-dehydrorhamnose reductase
MGFRMSNIAARRAEVQSILILGGEGMLGHKMTQILRMKYPDTTCTIMGSLADAYYERIDIFKQGPVIEKVDAMDLSKLEKVIKHKKWDVIINCIGIVKQREDATNALISITLNSLLPHRLAAITSEWGGRVIHFSTDCVFNGRRGRYIEEDASSAEDLYGKSKYLGEVPDAKNTLTLRTSIIGRELSKYKSLLEWFLAQNGKTVRGFKRHIYSGVTTPYISGLVRELIENRSELWGLYQIAGDAISKYDLLCMIRDVYRMNIEIVPDESEACDRSMLGDKFKNATGLACPPWNELLTQLAEDATPYEKWRGIT